MDKDCLQDQINAFIRKFLGSLATVDIVMYSYWVGEGGGIPSYRHMNSLLFDKKEDAELFKDNFNRDVIKDTESKCYPIAKTYKYTLKNLDEEFCIFDGYDYDNKFHVVKLVTNWHDIPNYNNLSGSIARKSLAFDSEVTAKRFVIEFNDKKFDNEIGENRAILEEKFK